MGRAPKNSMPTTIRIKKPKIDYPKLLLEQNTNTDLTTPDQEHKYQPTRK